MKEPIIQNKLCASLYPTPPVSLSVSAVNCQFSVIDICEIKGGLVRKPLFHVGKSGRFMINGLAEREIAGSRLHEDHCIFYIYLSARHVGKHVEKQNTAILPRIIVYLVGKNQ